MYAVGSTIGEAFDLGVTGQTFARTASYINGAVSVWNPTFVEIGSGFYRYSYVPSVAGSFEWVGTATNGAPIVINIQVVTAAQFDPVNTPTVSGESWLLGDQLTSLMRCGPAQYRVPATIHLTDPRSGATIQLIAGTCINVGWAEELGLLT